MSLLKMTAIVTLSVLLVSTIVLGVGLHQAKAQITVLAGQTAELNRQNAQLLRELEEFRNNPVLIDEWMAQNMPDHE